MTQNNKISLGTIEIGGESYFRINNHDQMPPFFMSIVSDSNHWMFISSNGGLTAGRKDAEHALFPYYTDDKLTEAYDTSGSKTIFWVSDDKSKWLWEPFSERNNGAYEISRNLYKNGLGNKVMFEEVNHDLGLTFRYQWSSSNAYGFLRESNLINHSGKSLNVDLLDGLQNILPYGVSSDLQRSSSNLVNAYKRSELDEKSGLAVFALTAIIVDRAEPSEALKANTIWSMGLSNSKYLLSSNQLDDFRLGKSVKTETDQKAVRGAYLINSQISLTAEETKSWSMVANVNQNSVAVVSLRNKVLNNSIDIEKVQDDVRLGDDNLKALVHASDGIQLSADKKQNARHYSNTLFNIMRGGIFDAGYTIEKRDFAEYLKLANHKVFENQKKKLGELGDSFSHEDLKSMARESQDADFIRLAIEYMPLKFSRRHGDPSRPWNRFSINTRSEVDGSKILDYEGNWRDIFQNWEALAHSYPAYIESMIMKFLNATTFEGYNPYRVTKGGFDWEVIEPNDPWSYIGYWGDHQIIYLLKFLEFIEDYYPGKLQAYLESDLFVYANVPYKIKSFDDILKDPKDTIVFDDEMDLRIHQLRSKEGADGALLKVKDVYHVNLIEKLLATSLAKLSNFIPEGGIWMNTQRPEWNDANNALVGNGVSMVTLYYLRRFFGFLDGMLRNADQALTISGELKKFYISVQAVFVENESFLGAAITDKVRRKIVEGLGKAGSDYREEIYENGFSGNKVAFDLSDFKSFCELVIKYLDHSIQANEREDGMYHGYNLMSTSDNEVAISYLDEMLEGQVAALSSGMLTPKQGLSVLDGLKNSKLFREDQYSYILYPYKNLTGFFDKNTLSSDQINRSDLLKKLIQDGNAQIIEKDEEGNYHFNGNFRNASFLKTGLEDLPDHYQELVKNDMSAVLALYEEVFNHKAFTGRSGTFYGYEGLGSIYWHMVSKLLLAVMEMCQQALLQDESEEIIGRLLAHYYEILEGIGAHKSPELYGAFPIDPYSHTPMGKGAQQPGMTGQVKEDILSRRGELGVRVVEGSIHFQPGLLRISEFLSEELTFEYFDVKLHKQQIKLKSGQIAFLICQVPVVYEVGADERVVISNSDGSSKEFNGLVLESSTSSQIFERSAQIAQVKVVLDQHRLRK